MARNKVLKSRDEIIDIAFEIIDKERSPALSARRLAKELNISFMTIYNYVENIDEIKKEVILRGFQILNEKIYKAIIKNNLDLNKMDIKHYCLTVSKEIYNFSKKYNGVYKLMFINGETKIYKDPEVAPFYKHYTQVINTKSKNHKENTKTLHMLYLIIHGLIRENIFGHKNYTEEEYLNYIDFFISNYLNGQGVENA